MKQAFEMLRKIKSVVISTVKDGEPQSRIIDIMHYDESGIYFLTCDTKPFYRQLTENKKIAVTGITSDYIQVRLTGAVKALAPEMLEQLFKENPSMAELFPDKGEHGNFIVFQLYKGKGEIFDLSGKLNKMNRKRFAFGGETVHEAGCVITDKCIACGECKDVCPFNAISEGEIYRINPEFCDECGICYRVCPAEAIDLPTGF